ncbi:MAG: glutamate racemase [Actinomycetota bacterium]|nr:glutamate racemase [Actinomycetota bacterium]MEA2487618.1 glutamate racemase [Actinomycetota bacterium]
MVVAASASRPIGMFDSGVGGLTVARSTIDLLPHEDLVYIGDTARCPYGPRPIDEVRKFALEVMDALVAEDVKILVVACNSAASAALDDAKTRYDMPVLSVIEPGVKAAIAATRNRRIAVIGTIATIESGSYQRTVAASRANVTLVSQACPAFVEFVERGDTTSDELIRIAESYLAPLTEAGVDTVILGCTHYPLLSGVIQYVMGEGVVLVSSAEATATEIYAMLKHDDLLKPDASPGIHRFIASSEQGISTELGTRFLGPEFGRVEFRPWDRP